MDNSTLHSGLFFLFGTLAGFGQFLDCRTTDVGLAHGYIEANSLAAKIYNKIGATGFFILKCMGVPGIGALLFGTLGFGLSLGWLIPMTVVGFIAGIKNYLLLKKNKVSVF